MLSGRAAALTEECYEITPVVKKERSEWKQNVETDATNDGISPGYPPPSNRLHNIVAARNCGSERCDSPLLSTIALPCNSYFRQFSSSSEQQQQAGSCRAFFGDVIIVEASPPAVSQWDCAASLLLPRLPRLLPAAHQQQQASSSLLLLMTVWNPVTAVEALQSVM